MVLKAVAYWLFFTSAITFCVELSDYEIIAFCIALKDIAIEFFESQGVEFDIFIDSNLSEDGIDIVNCFLHMLKDRYTKNLIYRRYLKLRYDGFIPDRSTFIFMETFEDFLAFDRLQKLSRYPYERTRYIVVIPDSMLSLFSMNIGRNSSLTLATNGRFINSYFLLNDEYQLALTTFEWYGPEYCNMLQIIVVNALVKNTLEWNEKLENHEKFIDYHDCELVMMLPIPLEGIVIHVGGFAAPSRDQMSFRIFGITPEVFKIAGKFHKFQPIFQPMEVPSDFIYTFSIFQCELIPINGSYKLPQVYFEMTHANFKMNFLLMSHAIVSQKFYLFVTPAKAYTQYEKLALPFDVETWTMLLVTFIITVLTIVIVNRLSRSKQNVIYGERVGNPFWNAVSIFFGISQTRLPAQNFPRFILTLFIGFCLIFRTCFQSKFFEYMTSEPRRAPPKTVEDLIERNYTIYITPHLRGAKLKLPNAIEIEYAKYLNLFNTQSQNDTANMAILVTEFVQKFYEKFNKKNYDWNQLDDELYLVHESINFYESTFYFPTFKKLINRLIETGVMSFLVENFYMKKINYEKVESGPKVLSFDDLSFGFTIWLGACSVSLLAFLCEALVGPRKSKCKSVKNEKVHSIEGTEDESTRKDQRSGLRKFSANENSETEERLEDVQSTVVEEVHSPPEPTEPVDELDKILEELSYDI